MKRWWRVGLAVAFMAWAWAAVSMAQGGDSDLSRRVGVLELQNADVRIARVETRLESIDAVMKGILIAVIVQIVVSGIGLKKQGRS